MSFTNRPDTYGYGSWNATGVGTNAGVTVTHILTTGANNSCVAAVQFSGDAAAVVTVESPAGTVVWRQRYAAAFTGSASFTHAPLAGAAKQNVLVKISASTSNCEANIQGYDV